MKKAMRQGWCKSYALYLGVPGCFMLSIALLGAALSEAQTPTYKITGNCTTHLGGGGPLPGGQFGVPNVTISFQHFSGNGTTATPGSVKTDANGHFSQTGFDRKNGYRVIADQKLAGVGLSAPTILNVSPVLSGDANAGTFFTSSDFIGRGVVKSKSGAPLPGATITFS